MNTVSTELPARRRAWLADEAYQIRLLEQARSLSAFEAQVSAARLRLAAASIPETRENAALAERDEVRVRCMFRVLEVAPDDDRVTAEEAQYRN